MLTHSPSVHIEHSPQSASAVQAMATQSPRPEPSGIMMHSSPAAHWSSVMQASAGMATHALRQGSAPSSQYSPSTQSTLAWQGSPASPAQAPPSQI